MKRGILTTALLLLGLSSTSFATELVYTPINPSFGGSPLNGNFLLSQAGAQNKFHDDSPMQTRINPVQSFQDTLTRSLLSMLAGQIANASFGNGTIISDVPYEFGGYSIRVHDQGNSMLVTITDPLGAQTSMTVGRINAPGTTGAGTSFIPIQ
jgi:curli production assembly/transport component CsgF